MIRTPGLTPWIAPSAADVPDLRIHLYEQSKNELFTNDFLMRIKLGQCPLVPIANSRSTKVSSLEVVCAQVVAACELRRLRQAELYWMDEDITSLAAAATPSREPVGALRMPAEPGLMLFAQPIGNIDFSVSIAMTGPWSTAVPGLSDELRMDSPIVAVSWSRWSPADLEFVDAPSTTRWALKNHDGSTTPLPYNLQGVWLTFWTTGKKGWDALPPNQPIAVENQTGMILTAAHLAAREARANVARLVTIGELFLRLDRPLPLLGELDTRTEWAQMVYAAWQLMTQTGTAQPIETETVSRGRHGRRRDQRAGIPGSGTVRLVRVGPASSTPSTCDPKAY